MTLIKISIVEVVKDGMSGKTRLREVSLLFGGDPILYIGPVPIASRLQVWFTIPGLNAPVAYWIGFSH